MIYFLYQMYARSATGLSPESVVFYGCTDFTISKTNYAYMLRPEAVESFYYLHHLTGDPVYRVSYMCCCCILLRILTNTALYFKEWGWEIFQAIEKYCKTQYGYGKAFPIAARSPQSLVLTDNFDHVCLQRP
jgi:hypothetical protein